NTALPYHGVQVVQILSGQDALDIQQNLDLALNLGHAEQVAAGVLLAEIRGVFDLRTGQVQDLADAVHHNPHEDRARLSLDLGHDDAGALRIVGGGQAELEAQIDYRDDFAPQIDHSFDVGRRLGHGRDLLEPHDFAHF